MSVTIRKGGRVANLIGRMILVQLLIACTIGVRE
jgi:hypothetical protein